ncbi:MAG: DUF4271 domain-containing protein [Ginsengibacter sp.]
MKITRYYSILFLLILLSKCVFSQRTEDTLRRDTTDAPLTDSSKGHADSFKVQTNGRQASTDTARIAPDTVTTISQPLQKSYRSVVDELLSANNFINVKEPAVFFIAEKKQRAGKEFLFYALCVVIFILGIFKTFYNGYFNNLFRVFFNTSIRQTQLTDQLLQAKLPSFILNIFFAISTGFYIWVLVNRYHPPRLISSRLLLPFCILGIAALYFMKYCILKFIGWMSGMQQAADNYIFIIFLVNKIAGIVLVPFVILLAFSMPLWLNYITTCSLLTMGVFFLSRYVKTYGVLEYKFPLGPLHFIIYITALEIVPLLLIYKLIVDYVI